MKNYYRVRLGSGGQRTAECVAGGFIGTDYGIRRDLSELLSDHDASKSTLASLFLNGNADKSKISIGHHCGVIWTVSRTIAVDDIVLCPAADGNVYVGEIVGGYSYAADGILQHRRPVRWHSESLSRDAMTSRLRRAVDLIG